MVTTIQFDQSFVRPGAILIANDQKNLSPVFHKSVVLITAQEPSSFCATFLTSPVRCNDGSNEQAEILNMLVRDDYIDDALEVRGEILNGGCTNLHNVSHPTWGYEPNEHSSLSAQITMIHTKMDAPGASLFGDYAISRGPDACKELRGTEKVVILGGERWNTYRLNEHFEQGVWDACIPATQNVAYGLHMYTSREELKHKTNPIFEFAQKQARALRQF